MPDGQDFFIKKLHLLLCFMFVLNRLQSLADTPYILQQKIMLSKSIHCNLLAICIVLLAISYLSIARPSLKNQDKKERRGHRVHLRLTEDEKQKVRNNCGGGNVVACQHQLEKHMKRRDIAKKALLELTAFEDGVSEAEAEEAVERRLEKIQELKRVWYRRNDLEDIVPADDGFWQYDVILSEEEADSLISEIDTDYGDYSLNEPGSQRKKRSASTFFEQKPQLKWPMPIHFWISAAFTASSKTIIRSALATITQSVPCIKFVEDTTAITTGNQIQYRVNPDEFCGGFSAVGRTGIHAVYLRLSCTSDVNAKGIAMHETIHALGGHHEQARTDRDLYLKVLYENIDPQNAYNYAIVNGTTSYGVDYGYKSIMHYSNGFFAIDPSKPTMDPLFQDDSAAMGGDVLTTSDKLQLDRMYCRPASCTDLYVDCGSWALGAYCTDPSWSSWMQSNCKRSCGKC